MYNLKEFQKAVSTIDRAKLYNDHVDMFVNYFYINVKAS
jgi:hypothetical protein